MSFVPPSHVSTPVDGEIARAQQNEAAAKGARMAQLYPDGPPRRFTAGPLARVARRVRALFTGR
jgi:hypothetical protein